MTNSKDILTDIRNACEDKKATSIRVLNISKLTTIADYFVLANGSNRNQIQAMCDHLEEELALKHKLFPKRIEGYNSADWVLLDFGDVVIHLFDEESRSFYDLDRIWSDAGEIEA